MENLQTDNDKKSTKPKRKHNFSGKKALSYTDKYTSFGIHRIGTETEISSTKWVAEKLKKMGFDTQLQQLEFTRFDLKECKTIVNGKEIKSFPFWFPLETGEAPIEAPLTFYDEQNLQSMSGKIVYYDMAGLQTNSDISKIAYKAKMAGALAIISTVIQPNGLPAGQNASKTNSENAIDLPSVIVSMTEKEFIIESAKKNKIASVLIDGDVKPNSKAYNVIAKKDNGADKWIVVTTPLSGWFTCNAERGGGVGLFLELANTVRTWENNANYIFVGNTGHEINFLGAHASEKFMPTPEEVKLWLHCGSAIACKEPIVKNFKFLGFSDEIAEEVKTAFKDVSNITIQNDKEKLMQSELGSFIIKGYKAFGLYGANRDFHTEADVLGGVSDHELLEIGNAIISIFKNV